MSIAFIGENEIKEGHFHKISRKQNERDFSLQNLVFKRLTLRIDAIIFHME
jgi:hypothetical protein